MPLREFTDADGVHWQVWSVVPTLLAPRSTYAGNARARPRFLDGWLAFQCTSERRRLVPIPERWEELPDEELARLCADAEVIGPPRRLIE